MQTLFTKLIQAHLTRFDEDHNTGVLNQDTATCPAGQRPINSLTTARMNDSSYTWIDQLSGLEQVAEACQSAAWIALDLEANSMFCYKERICLMQLNIDGQKFMVDTLALPGAASDLDALRPFLEDPTLPCFLHGGEYDISCMKRDYNIAMQGVWDSQQAASFLGFKQTGYGALVLHFCEVELDKSYSQYNWGTRPLDQEALDYAINDVIYLPRIIEALQEAVSEQDLAEEVAIANQAVMDAAPHNTDFDPASVFRVKGFKRLHESKQPVLFALFLWREKLAEEHDLPAGRIVNAETLIQLAQKTPTNFGSLKRIRMKSWILRDHGNDIMDCIKQAMRHPPALPEQAQSQRQYESVEREREKRLKDWRRVESERREVPFQVILPARALSYIKQHGCADLSQAPQMGQKRIDLYGEKISEICQKAERSAERKQQKHAPEKSND